ncbi:unnamed protein product (macronuclear) [Paramecium tetraurelia]|uniref:Uncharacterized protein n=1 Tax=Paramecium tetraurelia TaxID=5888 RepID=A0E1D1_PARTE|nr:uncharacterized protein GSPATT00022267001 [Paramecium tetraurelia]CAK89098.1 unnamed protein product [Paramecium tetraurelia]|eukprot:XP_001456495.1 hypothetical protein (macronuclear) [Paramecium tetraurelia strain d4-2]
MPFHNPEDNYIYFEQENSLVEFKKMRSEGLGKVGRLPLNPLIKKNPQTPIFNKQKNIQKRLGTRSRRQGSILLNSQFKNYKSALISTKSMDYITLCNHSNNNEFVSQCRETILKIKCLIFGVRLKEFQLKTQNENIEKSQIGQPSPIREYAQIDDLISQI